MVVLSRVLTASSSTRRQLIDLTRQVEAFVQESGVANGLCTVSAPHATAGIIANENERGLLRDMLAKIEDLFPKSSAYEHNAIDDNGDAHLAAAFLGHSRAFPVINRRLVRGAWQNVFLVELDGPRSRREIHLQIIGER